MLRRFIERIHRLPDGDMVPWIVIAVAFTLVAFIGYIFMGPYANFNRALAGKLDNNWLTFTIQSFRLDAMAGLLQLATQTSLISIILFSIGYTVDGRKRKRTVNSLGIFLLILALAVYLVTSLLIFL